jgi:hypothetical protein
MSQRLTLDPSSFERLLAAASVLQHRHEQEARHRRPALDETPADARETEAEPHLASEHDAIHACPMEAFSELSEEAEAEQNTVRERIAPVGRAEQPVPPLKRQEGDQKRAPRGSSFRSLKTEKVLGWRLPPRLSRRIASRFWLAQPHKLARLGKYLRAAQSLCLGALRSARRELHGATNHRFPSGIPTAALSQSLRHRLLSLSNVADAAKNILASLARYRVKAWVTFDSKFTMSQRRALTKAMTPLLVLLIMVVFTLTQVWPH